MDDFDWEHKDMLEHRWHAPAGADEERSVLDKFDLKDNDFDSESDVECPPLEVRVHHESESSSYDSEYEDDHKFNSKHNYFESESDGEYHPLEKGAYYESESSNDYSDDEDACSFTNIKNIGAQSL